MTTTATSAVFFLLLVPMRGQTIPCPGITNASSFQNIPLAERTVLSKILQHGYKPSLRQLVLPGTILPGNHARLEEGFVDRPFRSISKENCHPILTTNEFIRCVPSSNSFFESANSRNLGTLLKEQLMMEAASTYEENHPMTPSLYNPSWDDWKNATESFLVDEFDCHEWGYLRSYATTHSCIVNDYCQSLDPEFLEDLQALPVSGDDLDRYRDFTEKWGYGTVTNFRLGVDGLEVRSSSAANDASNRTLWMGYVGGAGWKELKEGNFSASLYTEQDCQDPQPSQLRYQRWDQYLIDGFDWGLDLGGIAYPDVANRTAIRQNFWQLFLEDFSDVTAQVRDLEEFQSVECPTYSPSSTPTESPVNVQSSGRPTGRPTRRPEVDPTASPTEARIDTSSSTPLRPLVSLVVFLTGLIAM